MEQLEQELASRVFIEAIVDAGKFNDYLFSRYFQAIKSSEQFEKIVNEGLVRHGFRVIRIGSGNFMVNPARFRPKQITSETKVFEYKSSPCPHCQTDQMPDDDVLSSILAEAVMVQGGEEELQYFDEGRILIVNNYTSLSSCYSIMIQEKSLGVDLEGRLRAGGSINLI